MKHNILIERDDGEYIRALHKPASKEATIVHGDPHLVILVHGFPKYQQQDNQIFDLLAETLHSLGWCSLQFDFTHCGESDLYTQKFSLASAIQDLEAVFNWAEEENYHSFGFIGEGLAAPILYMAQPENTKYNILYWPVFDLPLVNNSQFKVDQHKDQLEKNGYLNHDGLLVGQDFINELNKTVLMPYLEAVKAPTLILHGVNDDVIPITHLDVAREHLKGRRISLTTFDDGGYGLDKENHREACLHHTREFIEIYAE